MIYVGVSVNNASGKITPALHAGLLSMWWKPAAQQKLTPEQEDLARTVFLDIMEGDHRVPDMYRNAFLVLPSVSAASGASGAPAAAAGAAVAAPAAAPSAPAASAAAPAAPASGALLRCFPGCWPSGALDVCLRTGQRKKPPPPGERKMHVNDPMKN